MLKYPLTQAMGCDIRLTNQQSQELYKLIIVTWFYKNAKFNSGLKVIIIVRLMKIIHQKQSSIPTSTS
ncbi:hypothetical protein DDB_G0288035 [Dictyostelium discoideum AX4]|uniref:Putative uncharacterized protein DDB_G0288035 n=1 Tax=Dictyostelium discoideum TaxID=44689 RepID=Y7748_DICDI|nr:hypothetical protein DDB_G0288035 [Dictyostelium discoideum AX4]Q54JI2.1 RecName: Full=Putative uncharacterized protein DDB_G0288035 [Dictyostelium discoideum]EAL63443.1 hypothetical protein DDB_G0288035 [Dictyostelium discoideum AX4]|eukprot:XP_636949.1 hypothetical protein DDB_G0288035 [Dictyostelium discoideum AX4]